MGLPYTNKKIGRGLCTNSPRNFEGFTKKETAAAKLAYEYQEMLGHPSDRYFK